MNTTTPFLTESLPLAAYLITLGLTPKVAYDSDLEHATFVFEGEGVVEHAQTYMRAAARVEPMQYHRALRDLRALINAARR